MWNIKVITVPANMNTAGDVYNWLASPGVLPNFNTIFCLMRDNADVETWNANDFIEASWFKGQTNSDNIIFLRVRSMENPYLQNRNPATNSTDAYRVYQGETFTVFYQ